MRCDGAIWQAKQGKRRLEDLLLAMADTTPPSADDQPLQAEEQQVDEDYNTVVQELRSCRKELANAEEELREATKCVQSAQTAISNTEGRAKRCAESNLDELLGRPTPWNENYRKLEDFKAEHGHCNPRRPDKKEKNSRLEEGKLGKWCGRNRYDQRRDKSDPDKLEAYKKLALDRIGFEYEPLEVQWMTNYNRLKEFKEQHGHCWVSERRGDPDNKHFYLWVSSQRELYKALQTGKQINGMDGLTARRKKLLDEISFDSYLILSDRIAEKWDVMYAKLEAYYNLHGHTLVTDDCFDPKLQKWCEDQVRKMRRVKKGFTKDVLSSEQIERLERIHFPYQLSDLHWLQSYVELKAYKRIFGTTKIPSGKRSDQLNELRCWVKVQQNYLRMRKHGTREVPLSKYFFELLDRIGGCEVLDQKEDYPLSRQFYKKVAAAEQSKKKGKTDEVDPNMNNKRGRPTKKATPDESAAAKEKKGKHGSMQWDEMRQRSHLNLLNPSILNPSTAGALALPPPPAPMPPSHYLPYQCPVPPATMPMYPSASQMFMPMPGCPPLMGNPTMMGDPSMSMIGSPLMMTAMMPSGPGFASNQSFNGAKKRTVGDASAPKKSKK